MILSSLCLTNSFVKAGVEGSWRGADSDWRATSGDQETTIIGRSPMLMDSGPVGRSIMDVAVCLPFLPAVWSHGVIEVFSACGCLNCLALHSSVCLLFERVVFAWKHRSSGVHSWYGALRYCWICPNAPPDIMWEQVLYHPNTKKSSTGKAAQKLHPSSVVTRAASRPAAVAQ